MSLSAPGPVQRGARAATVAFVLSVAVVACGGTDIPSGESAQAAKTSLPRPVRLARADAARRRKVAVAQVRVVKVTRRTWPDSCLGLPGPEMCLTVLTPGYRAIFTARGKRLVYRTDRRSNYRLEPG